MWKSNIKLLLSDLMEKSWWIFVIWKNPKDNKYYWYKTKGLDHYVSLLNCLFPMLSSRAVYWDWLPLVKAKCLARAHFPFTFTCTWHYTAALSCFCKSRFHLSLPIVLMAQSCYSLSLLFICHYDCLPFFFVLFIAQTSGKK